MAPQNSSLKRVWVQDERINTMHLWFEISSAILLQVTRSSYALLVWGIQGFILGAVAGSDNGEFASNFTKGGWTIVMP